MRNLKRVLSLALALVMVLGMMVITTSAADFADAEEITYTEAMDVMAGVGLFQGDENENVNPTDVLTREGAATLLARIMLGSKTADKLIATKQIFDDVATDWWSAKYIEYCYNTGLIDGYNGKFDPQGEMTGLGFAKLLLCAMGYDADAQGYVGKDWSVNISVDALYAGLVVDDVLLTAPLTRELAAQMILQALDGNMKKYTTAYDYATGAAILVGPADVTVSDKIAGYDGEKDGVQQFAEKYFAGLKKTDGEADFWGRPVEYVWEYKNKDLYEAKYAPVAVYTEAVAECDIAEELGLDEDTPVAALTINGVDCTKAQIKKIFNKDNCITPLATKATVGEQGRLTEIYETGDEVYEVVMIDTFLAKVDDVTEVTYDRNGHIDEEAELTLTVYTKDGETEIVKSSDEDWEYTKGEMLLVYAAGEDYKAEDVTGVKVFLGNPESIVGGQTAYTTRKSHIVEDEEIPDNYQFNLDEAGKSVADHIWYFDTYGNLIGAADPAPAAATYGVISSIYWKDSYDGEDGYAKATITYMDGESESVTIASIDGVALEGIEGKNPTLNIEDEVAEVSSTKKYNEKAYVNQGLYKIAEGKNGLKLTTMDALVDAEIETGVPALNDVDDMNAGKSTQFLVWNDEDEEYETYTGIKNVPTYDEYVGGWYVDAKGDGVCDYIFLNDPTAKAATKTNTVLYYWNDAEDMEVIYNLDDEDEVVESYTVEGGWVNNEKADITVATEKVLNQITAKSARGKLMVLTLTNGEVTKRAFVKDTPVEIEIDDVDYYAVYAGAVDNDTTAAFDDATLVDEVLTAANGDVYYTEDLDNTITYKYGLSKTISKDDNAYLYIVYTEGKNDIKNADTVYITDVKGANKTTPSVTESGESHEVSLTCETKHPGMYVTFSNVTFSESFVMKLYAGDTQIAESTLNLDYEEMEEWGIVVPDYSGSLTANFIVDGENDPVYPTVWYDMDEEPTSFEVWADGVKVYTSTNIVHIGAATTWADYLASLD